MIRSAALRNSVAFQVKATRADGVSIEMRFMSVRSFFDTNVLIYADDKASLLNNDNLLNSCGTPTCQEWSCVVAGSPGIFRNGHEETARRRGTRAPQSRTTGRIRCRCHDGFRIFWLPSTCTGFTPFHSGTLLILRAAKRAGCSVLFSEDMQHAREIDGIRIVNPFE